MTILPVFLVSMSAAASCLAFAHVWVHLRTAPREWPGGQAPIDQIVNPHCVFIHRAARRARVRVWGGRGKSRRTGSSPHRPFLSRRSHAPQPVHAPSTPRPTTPGSRPPCTATAGKGLCWPGPERRCSGLPIRRHPRLACLSLTHAQRHAGYGRPAGAATAVPGGGEVPAQWPVASAP